MDEELLEGFEPVDPKKWPYSALDLLTLIKKWVKKISVDMAAHVPPKMACMIGSFWSTFGSDPAYKKATFSLLNQLVFQVWLKRALPLVLVSSGFAYQLSKPEQ